MDRGQQAQTEGTQDLTMDAAPAQLVPGSSLSHDARSKTEEPREEGVGPGNDGKEQQRRTTEEATG